jgi:hypothetical protein
VCSDRGKQVNNDQPKTIRKLSHQFMPEENYGGLGIPNIHDFEYV